MNWTGGKRNKIKVKLELQKQKEFFNRQRLKKIHSLPDIESRRTRTLTSIEVVHHNETPKNNSKDNIILGIDNDDSDFTKRKQFLLQDNDWAGVGFTTKSVKSLVNLQNNEDNRSHVTRSISPSVNNTNSLSPLTQNTTFEKSVNVESLEWHQFLTNQNDISPKTEYEWQNKSISSKTALHCVSPESITASNIEWNKFIRDDTFDSDSFDYKSNHSPFLSSVRYFNDEMTNYKDNSKSSDIIMANEFSKATQDYSIDKNNLKESLRISPKKTMNQDILKRIHDLELKNARFQIEISFLKNDIKWLMKIINEGIVNPTDTV